jgi:SPP1 family predicted phage head-tail adaptor
MPKAVLRKPSGELRHRVALQSATEVVDSLGGRTQVWDTFATVPAAIEPQSFVMGAENPELPTLITLRYIDGVRQKQRVIANGKTYAIVTVQNIEERNRDLVLVTVEIDVEE